MEFYTKIAFEGPPCSGKSAIINGLRNCVNPHTDVTVDFLDELATEFFRNLPQKSTFDKILCQIWLYRMQTYIENFIYELRRKQPGNAILLTDRGVVDLRTYLTDTEVTYAFTSEEISGLDSAYDFVYYFELGPEEFVNNYIRSNPSRQEQSYREILEMDKRTRAAWSSYPLRHVPHQSSLDEKVILTAEMLNKDLGEDVFIV